MTTENDYDEDGNNIVHCPICLDQYCPSKEGGKCPEEKKETRCPLGGGSADKNIIWEEISREEVKKTKFSLGKYVFALHEEEGAVEGKVAQITIGMEEVEYMIEDECGDWYGFKEKELYESRDEIKKEIKKREDSVIKNIIIKYEKRIKMFKTKTIEAENYVAKLKMELEPKQGEPKILEDNTL